MALSFILCRGVTSSRDFPLVPALLLSSVVLLVGCHPAITDPKDPKFIVAEKGDWHILRGQLDDEINGYLKQHRVTADQVGSKMPMLQTAMLDNIILKKLVMDKAATLPLKDVDKDEAAQLDQLRGAGTEQQLEDQLKAAGLTISDLKERIHEKVVFNKVLEMEAFQGVDPTDQEVNDTYMKYKDNFMIPAKIRASRILFHIDDKTSASDKIAKKKAIDKAYARVMKGEDFSKVAMEVSEDRSSAPQGGDLNWFQRGENEPGFDDIAFNTKVNTVTPVFETPLGYQFLKVTAIQPAGIVPLADARGFITKKLREMKMAQQAEAYTKKLLAESGVTYHITRVDLTPPPAAGAGQPPAGEPAPAPSEAQPQSAQAPPPDAPAPPASAPPSNPPNPPPP